jgi:hypothetical protein
MPCCGRYLIDRCGTELMSASEMDSGSSTLSHGCFYSIHDLECPIRPHFLSKEQGDRISTNGGAFI